MRTPCHLIVVFVAILTQAAAVAHAENETPTEFQVRGAVERSLPFLERDGVAWIKDRNCMSCHVFSFTIWSHVAARQRGIAVDEAKLTEWIGWAKDETLKKREWYKLTETARPTLSEEGVSAAVCDKLLNLKDQSYLSEQDFVAALGRTLSTAELAAHQQLLLKQAAQPRSAKNDGGGLDTLHQLILAGAPDAGKSPDDAWIQVMTELVQRWQEPDGTWKAAGQLPLQNRPKAESNAVTTAWTNLALASLSPTDADVKPSAATVDRLKVHPAGKSTELLIVRLLSERRFGTPQRADVLLNDLRKQQNADGGWSWLIGGPSDAYATGQSLYALARAGLSKDDETVRRGQRYLLNSQAEDGTWPVPPENITGTRRKNLQPIYRYWGTAWATIGLTETMLSEAPRSSTAGVSTR